MSEHLLMRARRGRRARRSRGQALVEFAAFFVLVMFLLAGVVNIGGLLNDHVSLEYATRQAARTGAVLGQSSNADCAIVGAINAATSNMPNLQVNTIIIYKANASGQPQGLSTETIYSGTATCDPLSGTITPSATTNNYPPSSRSNTPYTEDSLGVEIDYSYTFQIPLITTGAFNAYDRAVMPVSPIVNPTP